jgi:hypothetical protein
VTSLARAVLGIIIPFRLLASTRRPGPRWRRLAPNEKVMALDAIEALRLSVWEQEFVASIDATLHGNPYAHLTQKQEAVLDGLLARASGGSR